MVGDARIVCVWGGEMSARDERVCRMYNVMLHEVWCWLLALARRLGITYISYLSRSSSRVRAILNTFVSNPILVPATCANIISLHCIRVISAAFRLHLSSEMSTVCRLKSKCKQTLFENVYRKCTKKQKNKSHKALPRLYVS